jgi:hypothetical protein
MAQDHAEQFAVDGGIRLLTRRLNQSYRRRTWSGSSATRA